MLFCKVTALNSFLIKHRAIRDRSNEFRRKECLCVEFVENNLNKNHHCWTIHSMRYLRCACRITCICRFCLISKSEVQRAISPVVNVRDRCCQLAFHKVGHSNSAVEHQSGIAKSDQTHLAIPLQPARHSDFFCALAVLSVVDGDFGCLRIGRGGRDRDGLGLEVQLNFSLFRRFEKNKSLPTSK